MVSSANRRAAHTVSALLRQAVAKPAPFSSSSAAGIAVARRSIPAAHRTAWRLPAQASWRITHANHAGAASPSSLSLVAHRAYSSSAPIDNKIWSFEDIRKLTKTTDSPIVIVDTREPAELQDTGRIPGAINIPVTSAPDSFFVPEEDFEDRFGFARPDRDTEVVFYCKAGVRSRAAAGLAKEAGWTKVGEYPGSWLDWSGNGGEVER